MKSKLSLYFLTLTSLVVSTQNTIAQPYIPSGRSPVADSTMNTQVLGNGNNFNITGGQTKGQTLFHSFTEFSVPANGSANFVNITNPRDIITRVTGSNLSDINGLINTNGANFFLINPNGITFGPSAELNVGKAFMATTANSIDLVDGSGRAITFGTNKAGDAPLLSIAPNVLFNVSNLTMGGGNGQINNYGTLKTNNNNQYIGLIGGNIQLDGTYALGDIFAPGGRVDLGAVTDASSVTVTNTGLVLGNPAATRGDISLVEGAQVTVSANLNLGTVETFFNNATSPSSSLNIVARNVDLIGNSSNRAILDAGVNNDTGKQTAAGGDLNIDATGLITLDRGAIYNTIESGAEGKIGNVVINANAIDLTNDSDIYTRMNGTGNAGNVDINTVGDIFISGTFDPSLLQDPSDIKSLSAISSSTYGRGDAGKITLKSEQGDVILSNRAGVFSTIESQGSGNSKGVEITSRNVFIENLSGIQSSNYGGTGNAGNVKLTTSRDVRIVGTFIPDLLQGDRTQSLSDISSVTSGKGDAGNVTIKAEGNVVLGNRAGIFTNINAKGEGISNGVKIDAQNIQLETFSKIESSNDGGTGKAGNVNLTAKGNVNVIGTFIPDLLQGDKTESLSNISSATGSKGGAGNVSIKAEGDVFLGNRAGIFTNIRETGEGNSEGVTIAARNVTLQNFGYIQSDNFGGIGKAGDISITTTGDLQITGVENSESTVLQNSSSPLSSISSSTFGRGNTGKVSINATGDIILENGAGIFSNIKNNDIPQLDSEGSAILAEGKSQGILIENARNLQVTNNSSIQSSNDGDTGDAGDITIKIKGNFDIFGADFQSALYNSKQDLTLGISGVFSGTEGKGDTGKITIETGGDINLANRAGIFSQIDFPRSATTTENSQPVEIKAEGKSQGIEITNARNINLVNLSSIESTNFGGKGNAGSIKIKNTGDLNIVGVINSESPDLLNTNTVLSSISSNTFGKGDTGKITIETGGDINLINGAAIFSGISPSNTFRVDSQGDPIEAEGKSQGIDIKNARNLNLINFSTIQSTNFGGNGNAGDIDIKISGDLNIFGADFESALYNSKQDLTLGISGVFSGTQGKGDTGKITIETAGDINISNRAGIFSQIASPITPPTDGSNPVYTIEADGKSQGIEIKNARNLNLNNSSSIQSTNFGGKGDAGDINIENIGSIKITGVDDPQSSLIPNSNGEISFISSSTLGKGKTGKITISKVDDITLANGAGIFSTIISNNGFQIFDPQGVEIKVEGSSKGIEINNTRNLNLSNSSSIRSDNNSITDNVKNNAGNITLTTTGDIKIDSGSFVSSSTYGTGDTGKITIGTDGDLIFTNRSGLFSSISPIAAGDSQGIEITKARNLTLIDDSKIRADNNGGNGKSGQIKIATTGKLSLNQSGIFSTIDFGSKGSSEGIKIDAGEVELKNSEINSGTFSTGNAGIVTINSKGKYEADGSIIRATTSGDGAAGNIDLNANSIILNGGSQVQTISYSNGKAGNLTVTTPTDNGFITVRGNAPSINGKLPDGSPGGFASALLATAEKDSSSPAGKISLTTGTLNLDNSGSISTRTRTNKAIIQPNNSEAGSISIDAKNINITGGGQISTTSTGNAPAGNVIFKNPNAKLIISGSDPNYNQRIADLKAAFPEGNKVENIIDIASGNIVISSNFPNYQQEKADLLAASPNNYKVESNTIESTTEVIDFITVPVNEFSGIFATNREASTSKGGSITLNPASLKVADNGQISVSNQGTGEGGSIFVFSNIATLNNGKISAEAKNATGGNITISLSDYVLLRNGSSISTNSGSSTSDGKGGNITIGSPLIIALPGNNDITANGNAGKGGEVTITSDGLFGIQSRGKGQDSLFTSDITASSELGPQGDVNIDTPDTDPGRDTTELPNTTTDASNQISQVCSANTRENKLTVTGRGGLPPNANDPLTSDVVWQDARATNSQPAVSSTPTPAKFAPPAVGMVFDGKGKVTLIAAGTQAQTGTRVVCPQTMGK